MIKYRFLLASLAALALGSAAFAAQAAPRAPASAPAPVVAAAAEAAPTAPSPAAPATASTAQPARKEDEVDASTAELEASGDPQPGETNGEVGAAVQPIPPTHVDARVLADCDLGKPNDLASVPVERVSELEASHIIDTHPAAVDYARRLAAGEIQG